MGHNLESHSSVHNLREVVSPTSRAAIENWGDNGVLKNMRVAQVSYVNILQGIDKAYKERFSIMPCNLDWSTANSRRFTVSLKHGKCLKFIASSYGDIFVVFATNPHNEHTWYMVQISSYGVAFYRAGLVVKHKLDTTSGSLKDNDLFRRFFICMNYEIRKLPKLSNDKRNSHYSQNKDFYFKYEQELEQTGLYIQYGIIQGYDSKETVHLSYFDKDPLELRYYMFGSYDSKVYVYDISVNEMLRDEEAELRCSVNNLTYYDEIRCRHLCHENCLGCFKSNSSLNCKKCRYGEFYDNRKLICLSTCPRGFEKNTTAHNCQDIDECKRMNTNDTVVIYKSSYHSEIYKWDKCSNASICTNKVGSFNCTCLSGYYGDGFDCFDIDECELDKLKKFNANCPQNSRCINYPGGYKCECLKGFELKNNQCIGMSLIKNF